MHELSVAMEIISIVEKEIEKHGLSKLAEIKLRIGTLSGIDPEALKFGFSAASADTVLDGTNLDIEWVKVQGKCMACGKLFEIIDLEFMCPFCQSVNIETAAGQEMDIIGLTEI